MTVWLRAQVVVPQRVCIHECHPLSQRQRGCLRCACLDLQVFAQIFNHADPGAINLIGALAALKNVDNETIAASNAGGVAASPQVRPDLVLCVMWLADNQSSLSCTCGRIGIFVGTPELF